MAYRPPIHRGRANAQRLKPQVSRQALIEALASRLAMLFGEEPAPRDAPRENPIIPPRPPLRGQPHFPPRGPFRGEPVIPPRVPPRETPWDPPTEERTYVAPPSAWDWIRQPGFYDEDRSFGDRY